MANIGYRTFNGTSDVADLNIGNIASGSSLDCWIWAGRMLSDAIGGEIISCPGYDPLDLYAVNDGGHNTVRMFDGVVDSSADSPSGPAWFAGDGFVIMAARRVSSTVIRWSKAVYSGGAWGTFTHTNGQTVFGNRTYPSSGVLIVGNAAPINIDLALIARTTSSSDADIATLTTDLTKWTGLPNVTNVWRFDGGSIVDLKGTASQSSLTGTTVTANGFPLDAGSSTVTGTAAITAAKAVVSAAGSSTTGSAAITAAKAVVSAAGTATGSTVTGTAAITAAKAVVTAAGTSVTGAAAITAAKAVVTASGSASSGVYAVYDDFGGSSVDSGIWTVYNRLGDQTNNEVNAVIPANAVVTGGELQILSKFEDVSAGDTTTGAPNPRTVHYTSAQLASTATFLYGDVQVRAKIPGGTGLWPLIWMLGNGWQATQPFTANDPTAAANWPSGSYWECDIAEFWQNARTTVNNSLHFPSADSLHLDSLPFDATTRFMVYRLVWTATSITWYVDAEDGNGWVQLRQVTGAAGTVIPNTAGYLILSVAIGGSGGGVPDSSTFPQTMHVDWARVISDGASVGTAAITAAKAVVTAAGTASSPTVTGTAAITAAKAVVTSSGSHGATGSAAITASSAVVTGAGTATPPTVTGSAAITAAPATVAAAGSSVTGTAAITARSAAVTASGTANPPGTFGNAAITAASAVVTAAGSSGASGASALTAASATVTASGNFTSTTTGAAAVTAAPATVTAVGTFTPPLVTGTATLVAAAAVVHGTGFFGVTQFDPFPEHVVIAQRSRVTIEQTSSYVIGT